MNHKLCPVDKREEFCLYLIEPWFVCKEGLSDTVDFYCACIDISVGIEIAVEMAISEFPINNFDAAYFDDSVALRRDLIQSSLYLILLAAFYSHCLLIKSARPMLRSQPCSLSSSMP